MSTIEVVPDRVTRVASQRGFGSLVMATKGSNPFANFVTALVGSALAFGGMVAVGSLGLGFLRPVLLVALAFSLVWAFYGVVALVIGFQRFFLFEGGLVRWRNGRLRTVAWHDVRSVRRVQAFGRLTGYELATPGQGRPVVLETVQATEQGEEMARRFEEVASAAGLQVWG